LFLSIIIFTNIVRNNPHENLYKIFTVKNSEKDRIVNITSQVEEAVEKSQVRRVCVLLIQCISLPRYLSRWRGRVKGRFFKMAGKIGALWCWKYKHNLTGEDNAYAHLRRTVMGRKLWSHNKWKIRFRSLEQIFMLSLTVQRSKRILIKIIGE